MDSLSKLHDQVIRAQADVQHIMRLLAAPLSEEDRIKCGRAAGRAVERLRRAADTLSMNPASLLGRIGGAKTAERGPDYFRQIAAMRKTRAGGRPKK